MKKVLTLLGFSLFVFHFSLTACTTFFINHKGQMVFGRNYDWITGSGMVFTNQKGLYKVSDKTRDGNTIAWTSQYGSITFNQYGKEFPTGGMNEKGLVVELMWLDGTQYPSADERPSLGTLQWIQYQLDNCATVEELIATDKVLRIASKGTVPLHYLVADANGKVATIEFLEGKMKVHTGSDLPFAVLTNDDYASSLRYAKRMMRVSEPNLGSSSLDRFAKTCSKVQSYESNKNIVDYSFGILDEVKQGNTVWSIVYDISNRKIHFKTTDFTAIKEVSFSQFDFSCAKPARAWEMNQSARGAISSQFLEYAEGLNKKLVNRSFDQSTSQFTVSEADRREQWQYPNSTACKKK